MRDARSIADPLHNGRGTNTPVVCFDLGGVLVRICRTWDEACRHAGVPVRPLPTDDAARVKQIRHLIHCHQVGLLDSTKFADRYCALVYGDYSSEEVLAVHEAWLLGEYGGVVELIDTLHRCGIDTAALSNTNETHWRMMADYPSLQRIRYPLASHLLQLAKPDPAIFRAAESRLGVSGEQVIFFDDLEENIDAARAAGWCARLIDPAKCTATQMTHHLQRLGVFQG